MEMIKKWLQKFGREMFVVWTRCDAEGTELADDSSLKGELRLSVRDVGCLVTF